MKYTENNNICLMGSFLLPHTVVLFNGSLESDYSAGLNSTSSVELNQKLGPRRNLTQRSD